MFKVGHFLIRGTGAFSFKKVLRIQNDRIHCRVSSYLWFYITSKCTLVRR